MDVTHVEQRSYIKIAFIHGRNAKECYRELVEAFGNNALLYRTVTRCSGLLERMAMSSAYINGATSFFVSAAQLNSLSSGEDSIDRTLSSARPLVNV
ncbi:hypothetical protein ANN_26782 [Periplaneta americana]|uniref:Mos1 transposase HTH domain-containing protein n=1 Tax=Periplaneta americana TaxID=6978 RepID=A0ABQ8RZ54_PERAM|nr:hypothetical protein ANN_26782 [Periplaneta americana]